MLASIFRGASFKKKPSTVETWEAKKETPWSRPFSKKNSGKMKKETSNGKTHKKTRTIFAWFEFHWSKPWSSSSCWVFWCKWNYHPASQIWLDQACWLIARSTPKGSHRNYHRCFLRSFKTSLIAVVAPESFIHICKKDFDSMPWAFATLVTNIRISRLWLFLMFGGTFSEPNLSQPRGGEKQSRLVWPRQSLGIQKQPWMMAERCGDSKFSG